MVARGGSAVSSRREYASSVRASEIASSPEPEADKSARSRMNLEKEGLFNTHLVALFKKRASYFRRDKKAWVSMYCRREWRINLIRSFSSAVMTVLHYDSTEHIYTLWICDLQGH